MEIVPVTSVFVSEAADVLEAAYNGVFGDEIDSEYLKKVRDIDGRRSHAGVVVALERNGDGGPRVLGCVTYVSDPGSEMSESLEAGEVTVRMLGVAPWAQGRGVGRALMEWCCDRARSDGMTSVVLYSHNLMTSAHQLYRSMGFLRDEARDVRLDDGSVLWYFCWDITGA